MTTTTIDILTWQHVYSWAESLPDNWTARPGSCIECPIAQYLQEVASQDLYTWGVSKGHAWQALGGIDGWIDRQITMPAWVALFIDCVDTHNQSITKARLLELLERCKPEGEVNV